MGRGEGLGKNANGTSAIMQVSTCYSFEISTNFREVKAEMGFGCASVACSAAFVIHDDPGLIPPAIEAGCPAE